MAASQDSSVNRVVTAASTDSLPEEPHTPIVADDPGPPESPDVDDARKSEEPPSPHSKKGISTHSSETAKSKGRVSLACHACRIRKIKCDAKQPACTMCSRRQRDCEYDDGPKRRGPDRRPRAQRPRLVSGSFAINASRTRRRSDSCSDTSSDAQGVVDSDTMQATLENQQPAFGIVPLDWAPAIQHVDPFPPNAQQDDHETNTSSMSPMAGRPTLLVLSAFDSFHLPACATASPSQNSPESLFPQILSPLGNSQPDPSNLNYDLSFQLDSSVSPADPNPSDTPPLKYFCFDSVPSIAGYDNHNTFPTTTIRDIAPRFSPSSTNVNNASPTKSQTSYEPTEFFSASALTPSSRPEFSEYGAYLADDSGNEEAGSVVSSASLGYSPGSWCSPNMTSQPSLDFSRQIWWDQLLGYYGSDRAVATQQVVDDLKHLFRVSNHLISFIHVPLFFASLHSPTERESMQPSLVFAVLALSTFLKSSDLELGAEGRATALWLRDQAQATLEASLNVGSVTPGLAQAALLLVIFEASGHPQHSTSRCASSLALLDAIITTLGLLDMDAAEPGVSHFAQHTVPSIAITATHLRHLHMLYPEESSTVADGGCSCSLFQIETTSPESKKLTPSWLTCPGWNSGWSLVDTRKEEQRRLVWCALAMAGGCVTYWMSQGDRIPDFNIWKPWKYRVLFPGEILYRSKCSLNDRSPKDTIWALYARCQLLYASCLAVQKDNSLKEAEKGQFAVQAWLEAERLEAALDTHSCRFEQSSLYHGREFLFNTQNLVSSQFKRYVPHPHLGDTQFNRQKAEAWLHHRRRVATYLTHNLNIITGHDDEVFSHRPFFQFHLLGVGAHALQIWQQDQSILIALELSKSLLPAIEYLGTIFPSEWQQLKYRILHHRLAQACLLAGIALPPPASTSLVSQFSTTTTTTT